MDLNTHMLLLFGVVHYYLLLVLRYLEIIIKIELFKIMFN